MTGVNSPYTSPQGNLFQKSFLRKVLVVHLLFSMYVGALYGGEWKAASSKVVITPSQSMWLVGYASRDKPSDGKLQDLWAKVLVLEDSVGSKAVLITADIIGFPREFAFRIRKALYKNHGLTDAQVIFNSSHTHSVPVLKDVLRDYYARPLDAEQIQRIEDYTDELEEKIVKAVAEAMGRLMPVRIYYANGVARFQVNRRNNIEANLAPETPLNGTNDYAVPVLKVENRDGTLAAIVFGHACHPTILSGYKWSGDYVGYAQIEIEKMFPSTNTLFFQGCGGDQNPLPRRTETLAQQYGLTLAASVAASVNQKMNEVPPRIQTGYRETNLPLGPVPSRADLLKIEGESNGYKKVWARRLIDQIDQGQPLMTSYPHYPIQIWDLGGLPWVVLGGEVVIEYALKIKEIFGNPTFVMGYSNDMMAYIPSLKVLKEGGYEGARSQIYFKGMSKVWESKQEYYTA